MSSPGNLLAKGEGWQASLQTQTTCCTDPCLKLKGLCEFIFIGTDNPPQAGGTLFVSGIPGNLPFTPPSIVSSLFGGASVLQIYLVSLTTSPRKHRHPNSLKNQLIDDVTAGEQERPRARSSGVLLQRSHFSPLALSTAAATRCVMFSKQALWPTGHNQQVSGRNGFDHTCHGKQGFLRFPQHMNQTPRLESRLRSEHSETTT